MRKITEQAVENFYNKTPFSSGNTQVVVETENDIDTAYLVLHGSKIASYNETETCIRTCGYNTNVTKERLRGILGKCEYILYQKKGDLFLESTIDNHTLSLENNKEWFQVTCN